MTDFSSLTKAKLVELANAKGVAAPETLTKLQLVEALSKEDVPAEKRKPTLSEQIAALKAERKG